MLFDLVPIFAMITGIGGTLGIMALTMSHKRKMIELKMREKELDEGHRDAELGPVVESLCEDLNDTRAQVAELQERLEFTERLLSSGNSPEKDLNR